MNTRSNISLSRCIALTFCTGAQVNNPTVSTGMATQPRATGHESKQFTNQFNNRPVSTSVKNKAQWKQETFRKM